MPTAGISCVRDVRWSAAKIVIGIRRADLGKRGWFSRTTQGEIAGLLEHLYPGITALWEGAYGGKRKPEGFGYWATHRGRHAHQNKELERFKRLPPLWELVTDRLARERPTDPRELAAIVEQVIEVELDGEPAAYIRQHPLLLNEGYVGETQNLSARDHGNAGHRLAWAWPTVGKKDAINLQNSIWDNLFEDEIVVSGRRGVAGLVTIKEGLVLVEEARRVVRLRLKWFTRATAGVGFETLAGANERQRGRLFE